MESVTRICEATTAPIANPTFRITRILAIVMVRYSATVTDPTSVCRTVVEEYLSADWSDANSTKTNQLVANDKAITTVPYTQANNT